MIEGCRVNEKPVASQTTEISIALARQVAAAYLDGLGRSNDARIVTNGGGDDFPEVRIALAAGQAAQRRAALLERALRCYADPSFWDAEGADASLAHHDLGEIARSALLGKEHYAQHRD